MLRPTYFYPKRAIIEIFKMFAAFAVASSAADATMHFC